MDELTNLVEFAEETLRSQTGEYFSELQRMILVSTLQGDRKTYEQIADECGYSAKYLRQDVAPKLWQTLSDLFQEKVSKTNIKGVIERQIRHSTSVQTNPASPSAPPSFSVRLSSPQAEKGNILLVDDQPQNLNLLSELLEEQGYEVRQAINGEMALQTARVALPDLILLDIQMPDLDGYTVCQRLKSDAQTQSIPVIFVSALDESWDKVRGFSVGGVDYIAKPFKVIEVLARVENQLKIQHLQRELREKNRQLEEAMQALSRLTTIDPAT